MCILSGNSGLYKSNPKLHYSLQWRYTRQSNGEEHKATLPLKSNILLKDCGHIYGTLTGDSTSLLLLWRSNFEDRFSFSRKGKQKQQCKLMKDKFKGLVRKFIKLPLSSSLGKTINLTLKMAWICPSSSRCLSLWNLWYFVSVTPQTWKRKKKMISVFHRTQGPEKLN